MMMGSRRLIEGAQFDIVPSLALLGEEGHHVFSLGWVSACLAAAPVVRDVVLLENCFLAIVGQPYMPGPPVEERLAR